MPVLADTSIWVDYFRNGGQSDAMDFLIDENLIATNDLILAELVPFLRVQNQKRCISLLMQIEKLQLYIDWDQIMEYQYQCLKKGINGIGIPDFIIAQNANQNGSFIYTLDHHFHAMKEILDLQIYAEDQVRI